MVYRVVGFGYLGNGNRVVQKIVLPEKNKPGKASFQICTKGKLRIFDFYRNTCFGNLSIGLNSLHKSVQLSYSSTACAYAEYNGEKVLKVQNRSVIFRIST